MIIINQSINFLKIILETPNKFGIEIDIRSYKNKLILNHEPYTD